MSRFDQLENGVKRFSAGFAILGGIGLFFATCATCISIILKMAGRVVTAMTGCLPDSFNWLRPILGQEELVTYGVGVALFAALPWVIIQKGHIKIDLFEPLFNRTFNKILNLAGDIALAALAYLILTRQWFLIFKPARRSQESTTSLFLQGDMAGIVDRMRMSQESQILGLPLWPTYIVAEIRVIAFFVVACFCVLRSAKDLFAAKA